MKIYVDGHPEECAIVPETGKEIRIKVESDTNNVAEYKAVLYAIIWGNMKGIKDLEIVSDSQLVVNQMKEVKPWKVNYPHLEEWIELIKSVIKIGELNVKFTWEKDNLAGKLLG